MLKNIALTALGILLLVVLVASALLLGFALSERGYSLPGGNNNTEDSAPAQDPHPVGSIVVNSDLTVDYHAADNFVPLVANDHTIGVFYALVDEGPVEIPYPYQSTLIVTAGNMKVNGEHAFSTDGTIGNIFADVCGLTEGCTATVEGYKAGHVGVTIVFGGYEIPAETISNSVNTMFAGASNCGNKCLTVNVGYANGTTKSFDASGSKPADIVIKSPNAPFAMVNFIFPEVPGTSEVILDGTRPIGHSYSLSSKVSYVSVPETGGTLVYCESACTINGIEYAAYTNVVLVGGPTDGSTPDDLNRTITVTSDDFTKVKVFMYYDCDFVSIMDGYKTAHPDWIWK